MAENPNGPLSGDARRDVMLSYGPALDALRRARRQSKRDFRRSRRQVKGVYRGLGQELRGLGQGYQGESREIAGDLRGDLAGLTGLLGSGVAGVPSSEITAGAGLFGSIGAGALEGLADARARGLAYNTSARRQGSIESALTQRNMLQDLGEFRRELSQQKVDLLRRTPAEIRARLDELRRIAFEQGLSSQELALRARALNQSGASDDALGGMIAGWSPEQIMRYIRSIQGQ